GKEGGYGGHQPRDSLQTFIKGLIGAKLVVAIVAFPETAAAKTYIPVTEMFVHKVFYQSAGNSGLIVVQVFVHFGYQCIDRGKYPTVDIWSFRQRHIGLLEIKTVHIGI